MGLLQYLLLAVTHPSDVRALVHYKVWRDPLHRIEDHPETSGWDRERMRKCWGFLDLTSRSFAAVIKELEGELSRVVCIFYLVLRALDTVEDDMTLDLKLKIDTLQTFHEKLYEEGYCFTQSGPDEADRQVLIEFDVIGQEFRSLDSKYRDVIQAACKRMGAGMAHYAAEAEKPDALFAVETLSDYDLYCHYVAGIIGEGVSQIFSATGKESPDLGQRLSLANAMGLHLQKTNVMRDFREDLDDGRLFWPREIWGKYVKHPSELYQPGNETKGRHALVDMAWDAMQHAIDSLDYLSLLKNQSVFNFCAIPQVMAIATLDECFGNLDVLHRNVKIRKGVAVDLINRSTNPRDVAEIFRYYMRRIHHKVRPSDPHYLQICVLAGRVEQWTETRYPSWIFSIRPPLPTTREEANSRYIPDTRIRQLPRARPLVPAPTANGGPPAKQPDQAGMSDTMFMLAMTGGMMSIFVGVIATTFFIANYFYGGGLWAHLRDVNIDKSPIFGKGATGKLEL